MKMNQLAASERPREKLLRDGPESLSTVEVLAVILGTGTQSKSVIDLAGEEKVREQVQRATAEASYNEDYATTPENIIGNWMTLGLFIVFFALMSMLVLKLIDKDKR